MPRKAFIADLQKAISSVSVAGISRVRAGDDDGEFTFDCEVQGTHVRVSALVQDVADYPSCHQFMIFTDDAPPGVPERLTEVSDKASGLTITQLLELVSRQLDSTDDDGDKQMLDSQDYDGLYEDEDELEEDNFFSDDEGISMPLTTPTSKQASHYNVKYTESNAAFRQRIREDLRIAKESGFKVGVLGDILDGRACYVTLACRISKLGISAEAMQAWGIQPSEYFIAMLQFPLGYRNMDDFRGYDDLAARRHLAVRIGICSTYKPTMQEAIRAFTMLNKEQDKQQEGGSQSASQAEKSRRGLRPSSISRPLQDLFEERFPSIVRYRYSGMPWSGAEEFFNDSVHTMGPTALQGVEAKYYEPDVETGEYPELVTADHIRDSEQSKHSLPLVAMQFAVRHFVRCTEFCLICFRKMPSDLQALKPYVCDQPLCLYQYMSFGFGPTIEHEILTQPKVVDLLVTFCYCRARASLLKDFPIGLSISVPPLAACGAHVASVSTPARPIHQFVPGTKAPTDPAPLTAEPLKMRYNEAKGELLFSDKNKKCPLRTGDWIVIRKVKGEESEGDKSRHCRVIDVTFWPRVDLGEPILPKLTPTPRDSEPAKATTADTRAPVDEFREADCYKYDQNFDELTDSQKCREIVAMLDLLPSVSDLRGYLTRNSQSSLGTWVNRLSSAVLSILRWIIASNRACILQVADQDDGDEGTADHTEGRVHGMPGWTQFRFAMGAPDKELRFIHAVKRARDTLHLKYPTIFAWHGSSLHNWHSIIREGLRFDYTAHGRAFGNGVYHSQAIQTSLGYSGSAGSAGWSSSELQVVQAIAVNELVNAPSQYVSSDPHLVVDKLDWIQTRYLFVQTTQTNNHLPAPFRGSASTKSHVSDEPKPKDPFDQDPKRTVQGHHGPLIIPASAISRSRCSGRKHIVAPQKTSKRRKLGIGFGSVANSIVLDEDDEDNASVVTLPEDRLVLEDDKDGGLQQTHSQTQGIATEGKRSLGSLFGLPPKDTRNVTPFSPGTLDFDKLHMMQEPSFANPATTKRLMKDFQALIKEQNETPPDELGWYVDPDKINNMYQWIVELHSFDVDLPLGKDMEKFGVQSIVLELRFGDSYPMAPPFIRVIRPRFLDFLQGGGGHVTAGGAICMELLTNDGWSAAISMANVLLQVRMALTSTDPRPARLFSATQEYGIGEAIDAYIRACQRHQWTVPQGFREMAMGGTPVGKDSVLK